MGGRAQGNPHPTRVRHRSGTCAAGPPVVTRPEDMLTSHWASSILVHKPLLSSCPEPPDAGVLAQTMRGDMPCGSIVLLGWDPQRQMRNGHRPWWSGQKVLRVRGYPQGNPKKGVLGAGSWEQVLGVGGHGGWRWSGQHRYTGFKGAEAGELWAVDQVWAGPS